MMKRHSFALLASLIMALSLSAQSMGQHPKPLAQQQKSDPSPISLGLITCGPGSEVYSFYGHTAIHYINNTDSLHPVDVAINYGMFSFDEPNFVLRFIFGLTDYEMGVVPFDLFLREYSYEQRWVKEQRLDISEADKQSIAEALAENSRPENVRYRYNYFYDNCTTRARDMLLNHISDLADSSLVMKVSEQRFPSYRQLTHLYTAASHWARFGNDMLLGVKADQLTNGDQQEFLPERTMRDFYIAQRLTADGLKPLVSETITWVDSPSESPTSKSAFPLRPRQCFLLLLVLTIIVCVAEWKMQCTLWIYDAVLMTLCGLAGIVLFAMLFSQHPTVSLNLLLLLLNPLPLFFLPRMVKRTRSGLPDGQYRLWTVLICLFFIGACWQTYAEGTFLLASSLLLRTSKRLK